jgi:ribosomal protein S18 acetylase RimI-like enzyme
MVELRNIHFENNPYSMDRRLLFMILLVAEGAISWLGILTGPLISFAPFYIIIIALSTWYIGNKTAYLFIMLSSFARVYVFDQLAPESNYYYAYEIFQSIFIYSIFEVLVSKIKALIEKLSLNTTLLENRVRYFDKKDKLEATIRRATPKDINGIILLADVAAKSGVLDAGMIKTPEQRQDLSLNFRKWIEDGHFVRSKWNGEKSEVIFELWVSILKNECVGICMIIGVDDKIDIKRELHLLVVKDEFRGIGLGSAMLDFFCKHYANHQLFVACKPGSMMLEMLMRRRFIKFSNATHQYRIYVQSD